jgi:glycosyltransferase involved in cell wall biosynthesis
LIATNRVAAPDVFVLPWGLDPSFGSHQSQGAHSPLIPTGKIILTVTRMVSSEGYKGVDHMIQAMQVLRALVPDAIYLIVGEGDDRPRLSELAIRLGVQDKVVFVGQRTDEEVAFYHSAASIYAMPSRGEGMGLVFLEAMASGKPVVAAREAAAPELVLEGKTGLLVKYGDIAELVSSLARLLNNPALRVNMGNAGRSRFENYYTFDRFRNNLTMLLLGHARLNEG